MEVSNENILDDVMSSKIEGELSDFNPREIVSNLIKGLDSRSFSVIVKRFSLDGKPEKTLEEIGKAYGITRERVRQIESGSLKKLRSDEVKLNPAISLIKTILDQKGNFAEENSLVSHLLSNTESDLALKNSVLFILELSSEFCDIVENENYKKAWSSKGIDFSVVENLIDAFVDVLEDLNTPVSEKSLSEVFKSRAEGIDFLDEILDTHIISYLEISKKVAKNPYNEWGLSIWQNIIPKSVKDKAFIVLNKNGKPMHFVEISKSINITGFDGKQALPQTVHNELIKDSRFVLVGRGTYALKEWGYKTGTVADIIRATLKSSGKPMSKDEIIKSVLEQRLVKRNTVMLGLQNRNKFRKIKDGFYWLSE